MAESSKTTPQRGTFDSTMTVHSFVEASREQQSLARTFAEHALSMRDFAQLGSRFTAATAIDDIVKAAREHQEAVRTLASSAQRVNDVMSRINETTAGLDRLNDMKLSMPAPLAVIEAEIAKTKSLLSGGALSDLRSQFDAIRMPALEIPASLTDTAKMGSLVFDVPSYARDNSLFSQISRHTMTDFASPAADIARSLRPLVPPTPRTPKPPAPPTAPSKIEVLAELRMILEETIGTVVEEAIGTAVEEALGPEKLEAIMERVVDKLVRKNMPTPPEEEHERKEEQETNSRKNGPYL